MVRKPRARNSSRSRMPSAGTWRRAIGITYGGLTMNHEGATYSSVRMENSSIWPVVMRRRERISGRYAGTDDFRGLSRRADRHRPHSLQAGLCRFQSTNREALVLGAVAGTVESRLPMISRAGKGATERMQNGSSSVEIEAGELGHDPEELFDQRVRLHKLYVAEGMQSPYAPRAG